MNTRLKNLLSSWTLYKSLLVLGVSGLIFLSLWWGRSLKKNILVGARFTTVPAVEHLGLDFLNNYYAVRHWIDGGDPYTDDFGDPRKRPFVYSPLLLWTFTWCSLCSARVAVV